MLAHRPEEREIRDVEARDEVGVARDVPPRERLVAHDEEVDRDARDEQHRREQRERDGDLARARHRRPRRRGDRIDDRLTRRLELVVVRGVVERGGLGLGEDGEDRRTREDRRLVERGRGLVVGREEDRVGHAAGLR